MELICNNGQVILVTSGSKSWKVDVSFVFPSFRCQKDVQGLKRRSATWKDTKTLMTERSRFLLWFCNDWCFKTDCRVQLRGETHHLGSSPPPTCVTLSTVGSLCFTVPVSRVKVVHAPSYKTSMGLNKSIHVKYPEQCWRIKGTPQTLAIILKLKYPLVLLFRLCR